MSDADDAILTQLPARLKEARRGLGLSLDAVARLSGVSRSMVSQIERGESSPTIATLWNLTRALKVDFAGLLDAPEQGDQVLLIPSAEAPVIENRGTGCRIRILSKPDDAGRHEIYELLFSDGGDLTSDAHKAGAVEHLIVTEGQIEVTSGQASQSLSAGDAAHYAADVAHRIAATATARAILVVENAG